MEERERERERRGEEEEEVEKEEEEGGRRAFTRLCTGNSATETLKRIGSLGYELPKCFSITQRLERAYKLINPGSSKLAAQHNNLYFMSRNF